MTEPSTENSRHSFFTRLFHMALALTIIVQLLTSSWMTAPREDRQEDWLFEVHEYSGLLALFLATGFWLVLAMRRGGTPIGIMFPWFSAMRRQAAWDDLIALLQDIKILRPPKYHTENPLASAVHGLGLLLMTAMGTTGGLYFLAMFFGATEDSWAHIAIDVHEVLSNLVWAYLIGHASLAVIHHYARHMNLKKMWSLSK